MARHTNKATIDIVNVVPDDIMLKIFSCLKLDDLCLGARQTCRRWHELSYSGCLWRVLDFTGRAITTTDKILLQALEKIARHVRVINVEGCLRLTGAGICHTQIHCPQLQGYKLASTKIKDAELKVIIKKYPDLKRLDVTRCPALTEPYKLMKDLKNLTDYVGFFGDSSSDSPDLGMDGVMDHIMNLRQSLTKLEIRGANALEDRHLNIVSGKLQLCELYLTNCGRVGDEGVHSLLTGLTYLKVLDLNGTNATNETAKVIAASCLFLRVLKLSCRNIDDSGISDIVQNCKNLRNLHVPPSTTDGGIRTVAATYCQNLSELDISGSHVTDKGINYVIDHCPKLVKFVVRECHGITWMSLAHIVEKCECLTSLDLHSCRQLKYVRGSSKDIFQSTSNTLTQLSLKGCFHLSSRNIVIITSNLPYLTKLDIDCKVTSAAITKIGRNCRELQTLSCDLSAVYGHILMSAAREGCFSKLEELQTHFSVGVTLEVVLEFLHSCPRLTTIKAKYDAANFHTLDAEHMLQRIPVAIMYNSEYAPLLMYCRRSTVTVHKGE